MRSPLGKYSAIAAAIAAIGIIAAYVLSVFLEGMGLMAPNASAPLKDLGLIAAGAVFAAGAPALNGGQTQSDQIAALHSRLDELAVPPAAGR